MSYVLALVGSRNYHDYAVFAATVDHFIKEHGMPRKVVSGAATGADTLARRYAARHTTDFRFKEYPAQVAGKPWDALGRNSLIVAKADVVIAFRCTKSSRGTDDTIRKAVAKRIDVYVADVTT